MTDERGEEIAAAAQASEFAVDPTAQLVERGRDEVVETPPLCVSPDLLVGVEVGGVSGEPLGEDVGMLGEVRPNDRGLVVGVGAIPHDDEAPEDPVEALEERDDVRTADVLVVGQESEAKSEAPSPRAHGDGAYGRDLAVASAPGGKDRRLAPRSERAPNRRRDEEARFVEKDQRGAQFSGFF